MMFSQITEYGAMQHLTTKREMLLALRWQKTLGSVGTALILAAIGLLALRFVPFGLARMAILVPMLTGSVLFLEMAIARWRKYTALLIEEQRQRSHY